jgi:hypothetical protein
MNLTNKLGLPASIVRAVSSNNYKRTPGVFGVTTLLSPAYMRELERVHAEELEEDASDRIWSMIGQIGHGIAERANQDGALAEHRMTVEFGGVKISGQIDLFDNDQTLTDFKFTTVYSMNGKPDWDAQVNIYAWLLRKGGHPVEKAQIVAVFRDFQKSRAVSPDYPTAPVGVIPVNLWDDARVEALLTERIREHMAILPTPCTDEERWATKPVFAVMKEGRKAAVKLHETRDSADTHCAELGKGHSVVARPKKFNRCEGYCACAKFCPIMKSEVSHD